MRIFTLLAIGIFISSFLSAQQKGNILIGGSIGFFDYRSTENGVSNKQKSIYLNPTVGKFYAHNRAAGLNFSYYHSKFMDSLSDNSFGTGFFLRQYHALGKSFFLFAEEGINGSTSRYNTPNGSPAEYKTKEKAIRLNFYPGLAYAINKKIQLELGMPQLFTIYYAHRTFENKTLPVPVKNKTTYFALSSGFNSYFLGDLLFGAKWMLGKN